MTIVPGATAIGYGTSGGVRDVIESLGRTEDVRFSPNNRRLAVAAFNRNRVAVFEVDIAAAGSGKSVALTGVVEVSSASLNYPHGLDFIDDETLVVASRKGDVSIFKVPYGHYASDLAPVRILSGGRGSLLDSPGSVSVLGGDRSACELLICNNAGHSVTRHRVDCGAGYAVGSSEVLLGKWLNLPDGVCASHDRRWIAVSNHNTHDVLLYEVSPSLNEHAEPDGVLRCVYYPHGVRFSADGRYVFVADAGAPYVHIYASEDRSWRGARNPVRSFRIMDESVFLRGRHNPQEGGPKGIDIDRGMNVLVATSEHQPLVFFDLAELLRDLPCGLEVLDVRYEFGILEHAERLRTRAAQAEARAAKAEARPRSGKKRKSWRIAAPLRRAYSALWRPN